MTNKISIFLFLFVFKTGFGQTFFLDNKFKITIPELPDWKVSTLYCADTAKKICEYLMIRKDMKTTERKFSEIRIKYEWASENIDCPMGKLGKVDAIKVSGYKAVRWYGTNCHWSIEDWSETKIAGYSADIDIELDPRFLWINVSYFSPNENELKSIENEFLSLIANIKIERR